MFYDDPNFSGSLNDDEEAEIRQGEIEFVKHCGVALVKQVEQLQLESNDLRSENAALKLRVESSPYQYQDRYQNNQYNNSGNMHQNYAPSDSGTAYSSHSNTFSHGTMNFGGGTTNFKIPGVMSGGFTQIYQIPLQAEDTYDTYIQRQDNLITEIETLRKSAGLDQTPSEKSDEKKTMYPKDYLNRVGSRNSIASDGRGNHRGDPYGGNNQSTRLRDVMAAKQCVASLELELENTKAKYNNDMEDFKQRLQAEARKLGNCVDKARPLYEAQKNMRRCQVEVQKVSMQYRKSQNLKDSAKKMVKAAELKHEQCRNEIKTGIEAGKDMTALQMQLMDQMNQSLEMETKAGDSANLLQVKHSNTHEMFIKFQNNVTQLDKTNAVKNLDMARSYFTLQSDLYAQLEKQGHRMVTLEASSAEAKAQLSAAIKFMNSDSTHGIRRASVHSSDSPYSDNSPELIRKPKPTDNNSVEFKNDKSSHGSRKQSADSFDKSGSLQPQSLAQRGRIYSVLRPTPDDEKNDEEFLKIVESKNLFQDDGPSDKNNSDSKPPSASSTSKSKSQTVTTKSSKDIVPPEISAEVNDAELFDVLSKIGFYTANDIVPVVKTQFSNPKIEALLNPSVSTSKKDTYNFAFNDEESEVEEDNESQSESRSTVHTSFNQDNDFEDDF